MTKRTTRIGLAGSVRVTRVCALLAAWAVLCAGCVQSPAPTGMPGTAASALQGGTSMVLYALDPGQGGQAGGVPDSDGEADAAERLRGWRVVGSAQVDDPAVRGTLIDALTEGAAHHDGMVAACFDPRHAISVMHGGAQYDFVICFECFFVHWYMDDVQQTGFAVARSPETTFNRALDDAGAGP